MRIQSLRIEQLRLFEQIELQPASGINVLTGNNGAGKTSVLEAIHLLSCGRSFRGGSRDALIRRGQSELSVFAELESERDGRDVRLGLARSARSWSARLDGQPLDRMSRLFHELAVVCFEPNSHALITGSSELRRRFVDYALFHVEPSFIGPWRRYQRALKQRNALLKQDGEEALLEPWELELAEQGALVDTMRSHWLAELQPILAQMARDFLPELGEVDLRFQRGWSGEGNAERLRMALKESRLRERAIGHTIIGAHRSDWSISFEHLPAREMFSRGQEKLVVLACLLSQATSLANARDEWPVVLLDDLPSELDAEHLAATLHWLADKPLQAFLTTTAQLPLPAHQSRASRVFHVEQGQLAALV